VKLEWIDEVVEKIVRERPGCTTRLVHIIVSKHYPLQGWAKTRSGISFTRSGISFLHRRSKLVHQCLHSGKYVNKGRGNKHAWYIND